MGLGEPSACSAGAGTLAWFDTGAKGTLLAFFEAALEFGRFLSAIVAEDTINAGRIRGKSLDPAALGYSARSQESAFLLANFLRRSSA